MTTPRPPGGRERPPGDDAGPSSGRDRVRRIYRRLLRMYPRDFRARYEADLLQAFDDRRSEERFGGSVGGARLILFLLRDFVTSVPLAREKRHKGRRVETMMNDLWRDLRFSARMLTKNPMFTAAAVTTLALGIGMNAATFSAVHSFLLRPLDGAERPEDLVQIYRKWPGIEFGSNSIPHYQDLRDRSGDVFENVAAWFFQPLSISADGRSERMFGMLVSANFFQTYGVEPTLGRAFIPGVEDRDPGAHPVAVISYGFWETRFGADPDVVGRTLILNGHPFEVVGVAPADFGGPVNLAEPPIYAPLMMQNVLDPSLDRITSRGNNMMQAVGRLREGQTVERAQQVLDAMIPQLAEEYPGFYDTQLGTTLVPQNEAGISPSFGAAQMGMSTVMLVVVGLLLLIACVNVANLFLARAGDRRREMGVRVSLGAGRGRIVRQLLTESVLFSLVAGAAGLGLARLATGLLGTLRPPMDGPWSLDVHMDSTVLLFTAAVSLAAGVIFGMAPALQAARPETVSAIKGEVGGRRGGLRLGSLLVVTQMALSLLLLMTSGLFLRSLQSATRIDPGFDEPAGIVTMAVDPGLQGYDEARGRAFWDRILEETRTLPGVRAAGLTWYLPLGFSSSDRGVAIPGYEFAEGERSSLHYTMVSEGYLEALGTRLVEGRTLNALDDEASAPVIIVNERFAERFWPGESALGKVVTTAGQDRRVVGVVETGKVRTLGEAPTELMYLPYRELFRTQMTIVARASGDPGGTLAAMQRLVRDADADMPVYDARTLEDHMGIALLPARLGGTVLGFFGLLGLTLAAIGIYGVMAYSVSQRRRELGIRVAMGADRRTVLALVLGEGMKLTVFGAGLGVAAAALAARALAVGGLLYDVSALDPVAFTAVPLLMVVVATLAVYLPARRAAAVDPMRALKTD